MRNYTYHGFRIPEGWTIREDASFTHCNATVREIHFTPEHVGRQAIMAHEAMHARTNEKIGTYGKGSYVALRQKFSSEEEFLIYHEVRSFIYEIHHSIKHNHLKELKERLRIMEACRLGVAGAKEHREAAIKVIRSNIWKRANSALQTA